MKKTIYIFSDGELKRKDNTVRFYCEEQNKYLPVEDISDIFAFGEISITKKLLELFTKKEILLHYFNYHGYYMGTFYPREHYNSGYMILKQANYYNDEVNRLIIAKKFVKGSIKNIRQVLRYYQNREKDLKDILYIIEEDIIKIDEQTAIDKLMAVEGHAREVYYKCFDIILGKEDFKFEKRTRRPPKNYLNTLISFGNSMLYTLVLSEIYHTHLDPRIGFLHSTNFRSFSLNLDVAEIFKPIIIDRIVFTLIAKGMIKKDDFQKESQGIMLKEKGKKKFISEFDKRLSQTIYIKNLGRKVSYRRLIRLELYKLEKHLMEEKEYEPYISKW